MPRNQSTLGSSFHSLNSRSVASCSILTNKFFVSVLRSIHVHDSRHTVVSLKKLINIKKSALNILII